MKECPFLILPLPMNGRVYSSSGDTITKIHSIYVSMPVDCSSAVGTSIVGANVAQLAWQANSSIVLIV